MRHALLVTLALAGLIASVPAALARDEARSGVMGISEIRRGMKGYGLTVFEGVKPERFDVEIIDVLYNFRPKQELILVKTSHPRLDVAKVVAGMSGSPIYVNGKMIGAYAYGWTFGKEPVAGVTPIKPMLEEMRLPLPDSIDGWPLKLVPGKAEARAPKPAERSLKGRYRGELGRYDVERHTRDAALARGATLGGNGVQVAPVTTPLLIGGMTPAAIRYAAGLVSPLGLEPLQAGGGGAPDPSVPARFEDGGAIGVQLVRGDMSATGLGTVTRVEGDRLVAFGHPMMEAGVTALPTAVGKVLWFLASEQRSFKIGMPVRPVGALVNDRVASIVVSHSAKAPVIPVTMAIRGVPGIPVSTWRFEVAHEKLMTPTFLAVALGNGLQAVASERQDVSWTVKSRLAIDGYGETELDDYGVSIGGTPDAGEFARSNLVRAIGAVLNNPWQPAHVGGVKVDVELRYARDIFRLRGAELLEPELDAGAPARIRLTLVPFSGPEIKKTVSVPLPSYLAGKTLTLEIAPGYQEEREKAVPNTLRELVENLEDPVYPPRSVVVSYSAGDATVAHRGRVAENLPLGAVDIMRASSSTIAPDAYQTSVRHTYLLDQYLVGRDKVSVTIRPVVR